MMLMLFRHLMDPVRERLGHMFLESWLLIFLRFIKGRPQFGRRRCPGPPTLETDDAAI